MATFLTPANPYAYQPAGTRLADNDTIKPGWDDTLPTNASTSPTQPLDLSTDRDNERQDIPSNDKSAVQYAGDKVGKIPTTQAQQDGTDKNSFATTDGTRWETTDNSWGSQIASAMSHAFIARLAGKSVGESLAIGGASVQDLNNKHFRQTQIQGLLDDGYTKPSIQQYYETGDASKLVRDMGYTTIEGPDGKPMKISPAQYLEEKHRQEDQDEKKAGMVTVTLEDGTTAQVPAANVYQQEQENKRAAKTTSEKQMVTVSGPDGEPIQIPAETWAAHKKEFGGNGSDDDEYPTLSQKDREQVVQKLKSNSTIKQDSTILKRWDNAQKASKQAQAEDAAGHTAQANQYKLTGIDQGTKALQGGDAHITKEQAEHTFSRPGVVNSTYDAAMEKTGRHSTGAYDYQFGVTNKSYNDKYDQMANDRWNTFVQLRDQYGEKEATAIIQQTYAGSGLKPFNVAKDGRLYGDEDTSSSTSSHSSGGGNASSGALGTSNKPDGSTGTYNGKPVVVRNGHWYYS